MSSGFVYLSSILLLVYIIFLTYQNFNITPLRLFILIGTILLIIWSSLLSLNFGFNTLEVIQLLLFIILFFSINQKLYDSKKLESIPFGFFFGSLIIAINLIFRNYFLNNLSQDDFAYFSISNTYNYTAYYLVIGLVFSSYIIFNNFIKRLLFFLIFCFSIFSLESRSGFVLGSLLFVYLSLKTESIIKFISFSVIVVVVVYFLLNSSLFDESNQNDMLYSVLNYETNYSNLERIEMFLGSFESLNKRPFGVGIGNTSFSLKKIGFKHPHSHNTLANWIYDFGYIGLFLFSLFISFLFNIFRKRKNSNSRFIKLNYALIIYLILMSQLSALQYNILVTLITYFALLSLLYINKSESYD